jgi:ABC-type Fe3+/spermidine/putrescine transport system ATPase subunit
MRDGVIQQQGLPNELYERPSNAFVANFIGVSNFIPAKLVSHDRGNDRAVVETDRGLRLVGHVTDPDAEPAAGVAVTVAVRPERLRVEPDTDVAAADGWTTVRGRIHQGTYLGDQTEYRITTDQVGELVARRQNASGASTGLGPGEPVVVRWHEEANLVLVG